MNISIQNRKIRNELASDLVKLQGIIKKFFHGNELINLELIGSAINQLKDFTYIPQTSQSARSNTYWGYSFSDVVFRIDDVHFMKGVVPRHATEITLKLDIDIIGDCNFQDPEKDPLQKLEFNLCIEGKISEDDGDKKLICTYHLDRHQFTENDHLSVMPHPLYHFQFGGKRVDFSQYNSGDMLILETPRIPHYPMDAILGFDFVFSHFLPSKRERMISENREYLDLIKKYHSFLIRPYINNLSSNWSGSAKSNTTKYWSPGSLYPTLNL